MPRQPYPGAGSLCREWGSRRLPPWPQPGFTATDMAGSADQPPVVPPAPQGPREHLQDARGPLHGHEERCKRPKSRKRRRGAPHHAPSWASSRAAAPLPGVPPIPGQRHVAGERLFSRGLLPAPHTLHCLLSPYPAHSPRTGRRRRRRHLSRSPRTHAPAPALPTQPTWPMGEPAPRQGAECWGRAERHGFPRPAAVPGCHRLPACTPESGAVPGRDQASRSADLRFTVPMAPARLCACVFNSPLDFQMSLKIVSSSLAVRTAWEERYWSDIPAGFSLIECFTS